MLSGLALPWWTLALAVIVAWAIDQVWGDPPNRWHPVAWLGQVLGPIGRRVKGAAPALAFVGGLLAWMGLALAVMGVALGLQLGLLNLPWPLAALGLGVILKPLFAWRLLHREVSAVEDALRRGLDAGRERLSWLVSRDVRQLDAEQVRESAIETLAENLNDSVISPLLWFVLLGLPGVALYRLANTADAMWGYRGEWEWAGKWAAWADDVLSWPGARLTALLLSPSLNLSHWKRLWNEAGYTPSPNGGWPMGAMALRLGVRLSKPGVYVLNAEGRAPEGIDMRAALFHASTAAWAGCLLSAGTLLSAQVWAAPPAAVMLGDSPEWLWLGLAFTLLFR